MKEEEKTELLRQLAELKLTVRADQTLDMDRFGKIVKAIQEAEESVQALTGDIQKNEEDLASVETLRKRLSVIDAIEGAKNPSYFDEFAVTLAEHPYSLPRALFDPQGSEVVTIDFPNSTGRAQFNRERTDLSLAILYPGSFSYRYGVPMKIETGQWSQAFIAHLRMHTLDPKPLFQVRRGGRDIDVYKPIVLRARQVDNRNPFICMNCLSLSSLDENCFHAPQLRQPRKLPSSSPIVVNKEIPPRREAEETSLHAPLSSLISKVTHISKLRVGTAVLGFERKIQDRVTRVDYDPPLGMILLTRGIAFEIKLSEAFLNQCMRNSNYVRDVFVQTLSVWASEELARNGIAIYFLETIISGMLQALHLDSIPADINQILETFRSGNWIDQSIQSTFQEAAAYYPPRRFAVPQDRLSDIYNALSRREVNYELIRKEVRNRIFHSLAHLLLISGCVTSGCVPSDLDYLVEENEIVIFDAVDGGNGASDMIFEFCSAKESFDINEQDELVGKERIYKPRYFDEALAELLLPCQQGVTERIFHLGFRSPKHKEIERRCSALERQRRSFQSQYSFIAQNGVENCFVTSIGFHVALSQNLALMDAERLREASSICVHGCPDCLILGNKCTEGGFLEKYFVSKILVDDYFKFILRELTFAYDTSDQAIEDSLSSKGVAILSAIVTSNEIDENEESLQQKASGWSGKKVGGRFVKFAGFWIDCPIQPKEIRSYALLVLS